MTQRTLTIILMIGLLTSLSLLVATAQEVRPPGNQQGYSPTQPIAYSHRLHVGELGMSCLYCHSNADKSRYAGIPPASTCMNCHRFVTATLGAVRAEEALAADEKREPRAVISPELQKLYDAMALNAELKPDPTKSEDPIAWIKIHNLPDFVYFSHQAHVTKGVACQTCHGPVETMERVRQVETLSMGWCINCHRTANVAEPGAMPVPAPTSCVTCHF